MDYVLRVKVTPDSQAVAVHARQVKDVLHHRLQAVGLLLDGLQVMLLFLRAALARQRGIKLDHGEGRAKLV